MSSLLLALSFLVKGIWEVVDLPDHFYSTLRHLLRKISFVSNEAGRAFSHFLFHFINFQTPVAREVGNRAQSVLG